MSNDTPNGRKGLSKAGVAVATLLTTVGMVASVAYAATVHGTENHDWGNAKDGMMNPPNCEVSCGKFIRGTDGEDTIYGYKGWDYIGAFGGADVVHGGLGMEIIQGADGDDRIFGEMGHDHAFGGAGNDEIYVQDGRNEPGHVEQVVGEDGQDLCVVDEDPKDGLIANKSCETLEIKSVPGMSGATPVYSTRSDKDRGHAIPGDFYPGTYHLD